MLIHRLYGSLLPPSSWTVPCDFLCSRYENMWTPYWTGRIKHLKYIIFGTSNCFCLYQITFICLFQCLFTVRTTLKVCKLGERILEGSSTSSGGGGGSGGYLNEESILDLGRALYKLHLQLLLLLEAAAKMYATLSSSAAENKVSHQKRLLLR